MKKTLGKAIAALIALLIFAGYVIWHSTNLNPLYPESAFLYCILITVLIAIFTYDKIGYFVFHPERGIQFVRHANRKKAPFILVIAVWVAYVGTHIGSSVLFQVNAFRDQMPEFKQMDFKEEFDTLDASQLPVVDQDMARKLADKKLGERPSLGSQVVLGEPTLQQVNGELLWAVPTHHSGFFKWLTNMQGTPGYITVSATNPQDVKYVDGYRIRYQPGAYLWQNLLFRARFFGAPFTGLTDYSFELDDTGRPYWVITTYRYLRGFALPEATGALVLDADTGESHLYSIEELPDWVDRVQPESFIMRQLNQKGEYVHGYLNFSDKDKFRTSQGQSILYNSGQCYLMTGLTSVGGDESTIGFVMVNMVTKEPHFYPISGATEKAAQQSAEGKVQQFGYRAAFPLMVNLDGEPTYFMTLKDAEGLIKQYAYVSVKDYQSVGVGETVYEARQNYERIRKVSTNAQEVGNANLKRQSLTGTVMRIGSQSNANATTYFLVLQEKPELLFSIHSSVSDELALTREGDEVSLQWYERSQTTQEAVAFDNLVLTQKVS